MSRSSDLHEMLVVCKWFRACVRLLCVFGVVAVWSHAQPTWAQPEAVPDTLDWRRYFPLEVGNEWQYELREAFNQLGGFLSFRILADTTIEEQEYFVIERAVYDSLGVRFHQRLRPIRYDTSRASIVWFATYNDDGNVIIDEWDWEEVPCGLDLAFGSREECGYPVEYFHNTIGGYGRQVVIDEVAYNVAAYKEFDSLGGGHGLATDIGLIWRSSEGGGTFQRLVYARIGEMTYGSPVVMTSHEEKIALPDEVSIRSVYPNPFVEQTTVAYSTERTGVVELMLYDMLGRLVWQQEIGMQPAGEHLAPLNSAGLAAGNYILRLVLDKRSFSVIPLLLAE